MDESAVCVTNLRECTISPLTGYFSIGCSLHKALNEPTTRIEDIMKWNRQIAECSSKPITKTPLYLYPIDTQLVRIDGNRNIIYGTVFRPTRGMVMDSELLTATSILTCHSAMIESIDKNRMTKEKRKELQIFNILVQYSLMNTNLNKYSNMRLHAFIAIDRLCDLIESGIIDEFMKII